MKTEIPIDALIFGGGAAGLWFLDEAQRSGRSAVLIETQRLGDGQTIASQGILHGGLKYTLAGSLTESARAIREMPQLWRACLSGRREPNLSHTKVLAEHCHLWRTSTLSSKVGLVGARAGLRSRAERLDTDDRPAILSDCPGNVFRVGETVIDVASLIGSFRDRHRGRIIKLAGAENVTFQLAGPGQVAAVEIKHPGRNKVNRIHPVYVILTAGSGNGALRERVGLTATVMQTRPLHMVVVRGALPMLFGHCVDGAKTRATITSNLDRAGRTVWQVGGQLAEDGVGMSSAALIEYARGELECVIPGWDFNRVEWMTYRIDRAEGTTSGGRRPSDSTVICEGNVLTGWPTKLALVPELARLLMGHLDAPIDAAAGDVRVFEDWPAPDVALPPWESECEWVTLP